MMMKAVLVISGVDGTDLLVLDQDSFERYGAQGAFAPIEDLHKQLVAEKPEAMEKYVKPAMNAIREAPEDDMTGTPVPIEEPRIYGLNFTEHSLLQGLGIIGQEQFIALTVQSDQQEKSAEIIAYLLDHAPDLEERFDAVVADAVAAQEAMEDAMSEAVAEAGEADDVDTEAAESEDGAVAEADDTAADDSAADDRAADDADAETQEEAD